MTQDKLFDLTDRVAIVAGGAGYLGSEVCRGLVEQGAQVVVADRDLARAEQLAYELSDRSPAQRSWAQSLDISQEDSIRDLIGRVRSDFKRLDVLINATYASQVKPLDEINENEFTESLGINLSSGFLLAREAKLAMGEGGSMVFFSSMYGRVSPDPMIYQKPMEPNHIEYGIAKAGIEQMVRYLAVAWAQEGIRINGIAPGAFPNPQVRQSYPDFVERLALRVPFGRVGNSGEIVGAVVFLVSNAASYVTGHTLVVDGGWTIW